jgi:hypothetical protein
MATEHGRGQVLRISRTARVESLQPGLYTARKGEHVIAEVSTMPKLGFSDGLALFGLALTLLLVVLDKAGKLKGPLLLVLLAVAAVLLVPLALGNSWVTDAASGMLKFSHGLFLVLLIGIGYSLLVIWISTGEAPTLITSSTDPNALLEQFRGKPIPAEVQPLIGGPDLKRPFLVLHLEQILWGKIDRGPSDSATTLLIQVTLINRGEASIARNFKLHFTDENGVVFVQEPQPMNPQMVIRDKRNPAGVPADSLVEKASRPIEHGTPCIGWMLFYTTPKLAEKIIAGQIKPLTLEYSDYLDHKYTMDFSSQLAPADQSQRYVPGATHAPPETESLEGKAISPEDVSKLPGGPDLKRPMLVGHFVQSRWLHQPHDKPSMFFINISITNRGESSVAKDWRLFVEDNGKDVLLLQFPLDDTLNLEVKGKKVATFTPDMSMIEKCMRHKIEHGTLCEGWLIFMVPRVQVSAIRQGRKLRLEYHDYLENNYILGPETFNPGSDNPENNK